MRLSWDGLHAGVLEQVPEWPVARGAMPGRPQDRRGTQRRSGVWWAMCATLYSLESDNAHSGACSRVEHLARPALLEGATAVRKAIHGIEVIDWGAGCGRQPVRCALFERRHPNVAKPRG